MYNLEQKVERRRWVHISIRSPDFSFSNRNQVIPLVKTLSMQEYLPGSFDNPSKLLYRTSALDQPFPASAFGEQWAALAYIRDPLSVLMHQDQIEIAGHIPSRVDGEVIGPWSTTYKVCH